MADEKPYNINIEAKAQLEEIQKLLSELRSINAEISKINGQTFSAVSMSAAELSKTGKDLAKALVSQRIASDELNKMLGKTGSGLESVKNSVKNFEGEVDSASTTIQGFYMELGAMASRLAVQLPSAITATIQAFGQQEMVLQKLSAAVRANGGNVSEVLPIMRQFASDIQAITTYGDEQVHSMMAMATSMGVTAGQMDGVMRSAIGLSTALGMDITTATKAAASAIQGKTGMLQEYIPALAKCKTEEEKLAQVQKLSASGFAQAEEAANGLDGKLKQAANAWGDLQEVIGEAFAPTVKAVAGLIKGISAFMSENATVTKILTTALTSCAVGFAFTKVGGLMNVAKMFLGVSSATKTATTAMHALGLAIKANPIGLIASAAAAAVLGLMQLADYVANLESEEEKEAAAQEAARDARRRAAADAEAASAALEEYAEAVAREGETADDTAERIKALSSEIESLSDRSKWAENGQEAAAQKLIEKKKELAELQKKYLEHVNAAATAEYQYASNRETERKYRVEQELNAARKTGVAHIIKFKEAELAHVEELQKSVEIQKKYYADHAHLVSSEEDRKRIMADAAAYAEVSLEKMREESREAEKRASAEAWLNAEAERNKAAQRDMELEILRARAAGDEAGAKELEQKLRISQLSAEIFESTRKEGMSRGELERLQASANEKAREKYNLEKSITDEVERQNLAKDAQAKIEDILLTNKIEQLKSEGKLTQVRELERERENRRTIAGIPGLSAEDKEKLLSTMRQTNDYRDKQEKMRGGGGGGYGAGASYSGGGSYGAGSGGYMPARGGSYGGSGYGYGGGYAGAARNPGPRPPRRPRPATISAKYMPLYEEWQASGGARSGVSWIDYRNSRRGEIDAAEKARKSYGKAAAEDAKTPVAAQRDRAAQTLSAIESQAKGMAAGIAPGGAVASAANSVPKEPPRKAPRAGGDEESESPENRQRRAQTQAKQPQNARQQTAQNLGGNSVVKLLSSIDKTVKSIAST